MTQKNYYQILGVEPSASADDIKSSYRKLAFQYHPDRNEKNPEAAERMTAINEAYAVLSNPSKKQEYDLLRQRFGTSAHTQFRKTYSNQDIFSESDIQQIFEEMARAFGLRGFDEIFRDIHRQGGFYSFEFRHSGSGQADRKRYAPPSLLPGAGIIGGLFSKLTRFFIEKITGVAIPIDGADMNDVITINSKLAEQGGSYAYFHKKKSKKLMVKIPPGIRDGQFIRLENMGEDGKNGGKTGDLYLKIKKKKSLFQKLQNFVSVI